MHTGLAWSWPWLSGRLAWYSACSVVGHSSSAWQPCWLSSHSWRLRRSGGCSRALMPIRAMASGALPCWRRAASSISASRLANSITCRPQSSSWWRSDWRASWWLSSSAAQRPPSSARGSSSRSSAALGRVSCSQNSAPSSFSLVTPISPPICSIRRLEITRPRPVPPAWRELELSTWLKAWNSERCSLSDRPTPLSCTLMRSWA
ncbi:hypothetical protein D3C81_1572730 [compost metagenome]